VAQQIELSISGGAFVPQARTPAEAEFLSDTESNAETNVERWASTVLAATEPCLIINTEGQIAAVSAACSELLGLEKPAEAIGEKLVDAIALIDFTANAGALEEPEAGNIPPLLAVRSERLARGLMRVVPEPGRPPLTVDAIATPLLDGEKVLGSLTFFSPVRY
jgi:PAS domain-containing protein